MTPRFSLCFLPALLLLAGCGRDQTPAQTESPVQLRYADLVAMQLDPARLPDLSLPPSRLTSCSDPTGDNNDWAEFLNTGKGGWDTILDVQGPGYLSRAWFTGWSENTRKLRVYVDDMEKPAAEFSFIEWFADGKGPFIRRENFCAYSYLPVPYQQRLRIDVEVGQPGGKFYFQFNTARLPAGSTVETVGFPVTAPDLPAVNAARDAWNALAAVPAAAESTPVKLAAGADFSLPVFNGPGTIERIDILPSPSVMTNAAALSAFLRDVMLEIRWDGVEAPSVECPLGDFCGQAADWVNARALATGAEEGRMFNRLPMPHRTSAAIRFVNDGKTPCEFRVAVVRKEGAPAASAGYLHTAWSLSLPRDIGPRHTVLRAKGRGRIVGLQLSVGFPDKESDRQSWWILEGDEQIRVDEEILPGWRGTGLEDCFNGGWYYRQVVANPLSGLLRKIPYDAVQYRHFTLDAPAFRESVDFEFERGGQNNDPVRMESTTFYYLAAPAISGSRLPEDPAQRRWTRTLPKMQWMTRVAQFEALQDESGAVRVLDAAMASESNAVERARLQLRKTAGRAVKDGWDAIKGELPAAAELKSDIDLLQRAFAGGPGEAVLVVYAQPGVEIFLNAVKVGDAAPGRIFTAPVTLAGGPHLLGFLSSATAKDAWLHAQIWQGGKVVASTGGTCLYTMDPPEGWNTVAFDAKAWTTYLDRSLGLPGPDSHLPGPPIHVYPGLVGRAGSIVRPLEGKAKAIGYRLPFDSP